MTEGKHKPLWNAPPISEKKKKELMKLHKKLIGPVIMEQLLAYEVEDKEEE